MKRLLMILSLSSLAVSGALATDDTVNNYDSKFNDTEYKPYFGSDLELTVDNTGTHFALWSPKAEDVQVKIYLTEKDKYPFAILPMKQNTNDKVWRADYNTKLYGMFYTFSIRDNGKWLDETPGAWAKAVGTNGKRAAIIDFSTTNPSGWNTDKGPVVKSANDVIIYEMHHRDMSQHANSGIKNKGKFLALTEHGTHSSNGESTGIDHLKELGITHVHILPSYDFGSIDESQLDKNSYNWGYDPMNYNTPEGSYSTAPGNPATRILEMKKMIQALHNDGIGVIMDVVYNHTFVNKGSNFELTAPGYYYRHNADGSFSDASGCNNETASERTQMRDYIVKSVSYWAKEYHIDGFRFDLMGIHDIETMNAVRKALKDINPNIIMYGEGWTAGASPLPAEKRALKENVGYMPGIAVFSDDIRDAIKGHYSNALDRGFASGKPGLEETIKIGIVASTAHPQVDYSKGNNSKFAYAKEPNQIINYISCHDDLILTDKLRKSLPGKSDDELKRVAKLAQTIVFTSQGIPFMFAGEEVFRDKKGVHNSFCSPDSINAIDWNLKKSNHNQFDYYKNLIALRKAHPAFRMTTTQDIQKNLVFHDTKADNLVSYSLINHANGDSAEEIFVVFNGNETAQNITIPKGNWKIVAKDGRINPIGIGTINGGKTKIEPVSALILIK